ncbi:hypothetical protein GCM10022223_17940 [Kineosporia mesophila]|uniref:RNA polymerase sigma factor (Sigma-70 family) n=1 Tax=Kineosporia mesophila TaxID=566012 RepID=A0ABP6ZDE9_9ACTN|nr:sigma-70 family RNA polymerase sigma factor [Kineosporia mesophila]
MLDPEGLDGEIGRPGARALVAETEIVDLIDPLRRYVMAHTRQPADADDVVQEVLLRMLDIRDRLAPGSSLAYAIVTARNLMTTQARSTATFWRNRHRLIDLREPAEPDSVAIGRSERDALRVALGELPPGQREALLSHVLEEEPVTSIAVRENVSPGSVAAQLGRTRARLRVDYTMTARRARLPTARCRPVLLALSGGDLRRQTALRAGNHLLNCETCAELAPPLVERQRALIAFLPWLGLGPALGLLRRAFRHPSVQVGVATTAVAAAGVGAVVWVSGPEPVAPSRPAVSSSPTPITGVFRLPGGQPLLPVPTDLSSLVGDQVEGRAVAVSSVAANEGFWVGDHTRGRIWVQLKTDGRESRVTVDPGDVISFTGALARTGTGFAEKVGVSASDGAPLLAREGAHIVVKTGDLKIIQ